MHRTEGTNYNTIAGKKYFTNGPPATCVEENWLNAVQEEISALIEDYGGTLLTEATDTYDQLSSVMQSLWKKSGTYVYNDTADRIGIGTTSPGRNLEISSTGDATLRISADSDNDGANNDSSIEFYNNGSLQFTIGQDDTDDCFKIAGGSFASNTIVTVDTSGYLGINKTSLSARLELAELDTSCRIKQYCYSSTTSDTSYLTFYRSLSETEDVYTTTTDGTVLGHLRAIGSETDGGSDPAAGISFVQDGNATATRIPGSIIFNTSDGSGDYGEKARITKNGSILVGLSSLTNIGTTNIAIEGGVLALKEITTPTADTNYGKVYTKSDNKLYFQDGAGSEHEIAFV